jgi:hypothetical protein
MRRAAEYSVPLPDGCAGSRLFLPGPTECQGQGGVGILWRHCVRDREAGSHGDGRNTKRHRCLWLDGGLDAARPSIPTECHAERDAVGIL